MRKRKVHKISAVAYLFGNATQMTDCPKAGDNWVGAKRLENVTCKTCLRIRKR